MWNGAGGSLASSPDLPTGRQGGNGLVEEAGAMWDTDGCCQALSPDLLRARQLQGDGGVIEEAGIIWNTTPQFSQLDREQDEEHLHSHVIWKVKRPCS